MDKLCILGRNVAEPIWRETNPNRKSRCFNQERKRTSGGRGDDWSRNKLYKLAWASLDGHLRSHQENQKQRGRGRGKATRAGPQARLPIRSGNTAMQASEGVGRFKVTAIIGTARALSADSKRRPLSVF